MKLAKLTTTIDSVYRNTDNKMNIALQLKLCILLFVVWLFSSLNI